MSKSTSISNNPLFFRSIDIKLTFDVGRGLEHESVLQVAPIVQHLISSENRRKYYSMRLILLGDFLIISLWLRSSHARSSNPPPPPPPPPPTHFLLPLPLFT